MNSLSLAVAFILLSACAAPTAVGDLEGTSPAEVSDEQQAAPLAKSPAELIRCQQACRQGREAMDQFCRGVPDPKIKGVCWGFALVGGIACLNFCFNYWGS